MKPKLLLVNDNGCIRDLLSSINDVEFEIVDVDADRAHLLMQDGSAPPIVSVSAAPARTLIGNSAIAKHLREKFDIIAETGAPTLITGEVGTEKETAARAIHAASGRTGRFVKVSCPSLPVALLEHALFGDGDDNGKLELARGGTILLDEIGKIDYGLQSRLVQAMESGELDHTRILATTTYDLVAEVRDGYFREDLYYRLSVVTLEMPPLRSRRDDIALLIDYFADVHARRNGRARIRLTDAAVEKLTRAHWDGNVRQLESVIERASILCSGRTLDAADFHFENGREEQMSHVEETFRRGSIREMEKLMILNRLRENDDNRTRSAKTLDISVRTLRNKLHEYNVPRRASTVKTVPEREPVLV